ncbi:type I CRISPR-associated protein Cas7 [Bacillaceae bacterium Marseille-Q3522]|nr:type I CRISPR-associated protein Cas7 [Bacillaceae bacterium Marseille-Q3522]
MTKIWKKRVYGVVSVESKMANWNADFTGNPKSTSDGDVFGSDKAWKYSIKRYWENNGEKILYIKSYTIGKEGKLQPKELKERYEEIFGESVEKKTKSEVVLKNLFSALDVLNFGATFAVADQNIGLTGVVQVGQGMNQYPYTMTETQDILSPFRNSKKNNADASSLGKKIVSNEAHYLYPFSVNPNNYDGYVSLVEGFEGYTVEAFEKFKDAALVSATVLNTNSKAGCSTEFALFVICKENEKAYFPQLDEYIAFRKDNGFNIFDVKKLNQFVTENVEKIESIEVYYNPYTVKIENGSDIFELKNIFTHESISKVEMR